MPTKILEVIDLAREVAEMKQENAKFSKWIMDMRIKLVEIFAAASTMRD